MFRVHCGITGTSAQDSWAFAAPLFNPEVGSTGWCVDSSGNSKSTTVNFETGAGSVGGSSTIAQCP